MTAYVIKLRAALADRSGASATEYALAAGILAVGIAPAFSGLLAKMLTAFSGLNF